MTLIRWRGGKVRATPENLARAEKLRDQIQAIKNAVVFGLGKCLCEMHDEGYFLFFIDLDTNIQGEAILSSRFELTFASWVKEHAGIQPQTAYKAMAIYRNLVCRYPDIFEQWDRDNISPPVYRLEYLAYCDRYLDEVTCRRMLLVAAAVDRVGWIAEVKKAYEHKTDQQAQIEAESIIRNTLEQVARRELREGPILPMNAISWTSTYYRAWIVEQPCVVSLERAEDVSCCHVYAKGHGSAGTDFCNVVPMREKYHRYQHSKGWDAFKKKTKISREDLHAQAVRLTVDYLILTEDRLLQTSILSET